MKARGAALVLLVAAALLHLAVTAPARREIRLRADEHSRLRLERRDRQADLAGLASLAGWQARAASLASAHAASDADGVAALRQAALEALDNRRLDDVRLQVRPARSPWRAELNLSARGAQGEVFELLAALCGPDSAIALRRVSLREAGHGVLVDLEATTLGGVS